MAEGAGERSDGGGASGVRPAGAVIRTAGPTASAVEGRVMSHTAHVCTRVHRYTLLLVAINVGRYALLLSDLEVVP